MVGGVPFDEVRVLQLLLLCFRRLGAQLAAAAVRASSRERHRCDSARNASTDGSPMVSKTLSTKIYFR